MFRNDELKTLRHDSQRRLAIRGIMMTGAALLLPGLWGCKQKEPPASPATEAPAPMSDAPSPMEASPMESSPAPSGLMSKAQAQYQDSPKGDQQCSNCMHFVAESNTCKIVEGNIAPQAWCIVWAKLPA